MGYSGDEENGPCLMGVQVADIGAGSKDAAVAILAAIISRMKTGRGRQIDVSMTDGVYPFHVVSGLGCLLGGPEPGFGTEILNGGSLYGFYRTSDGRYLSFGGLEPKFVCAFLEALDLSEYIPRLMEPGITKELKARVKDAIASCGLEHWTKVFSRVDACVEPVLGVREAFESPHAKARGIVVDVPGPGGRSIPQAACPVKFSGYEPKYSRSGPALGQDTAEVLASLGYTESQIKEMESQGTVAANRIP